MLLKDLLERTEYDVLKGSLEGEASGLSFDSRKVDKGDLFICIRGALFDSHDAVEDVASKGASLIIVDKAWAEEHADEVQSIGCDVVSVTDTRVAKASVSAAYYGYPSEKMEVIGITGSKGKTTTTHMIRDMLTRAGHVTCSVGTTGGYIGAKEYRFGTTTPDSDMMQSFLSEAVERGCEYAVIEVSSQALKLHRVDMIDFDIGIFLNIEKGDHISPSEHKDFDEYLECKKMLLKMSRKLIVNRDDDHYDRITEGLEANILTFGHDDKADHVIANVSETSLRGEPAVSFDLSGVPGGHYTIGLPGLFNVDNAAAAVVCARELGISGSAISYTLESIKVPGRLDVISKTDDLTVIVDYAHNGLSTRNLLKALKAYDPKRIVIVFGCGGDRDLDRRPEMGRAAGELADLSIITTEHNRSEDFSHILEGIKSGIDPTGGRYEVIEDRKEAIKHAVMDSEKGDLIAVIGIGNDGCQHDHGKNIPHDDIGFCKQVVKEFMDKKENKHTEYFATPDQFDVTDGLEHYENTDGAVLLDVRMKAEYDEGHIPGAICVPLQKVEKRIEKTVPDKDTPIFCYCVTGARSGRAASIIRSLGYEHVYNIGGILGYDGELEK